MQGQTKRWHKRNTVPPLIWLALMWRTQGAHWLERDADGLMASRHGDPRLHAIAANIDRQLGEGTERPGQTHQGQRRTIGVVKKRAAGDGHRLADDLFREHRTNSSESPRRASRSFPPLAQPPKSRIVRPLSPISIILAPGMLRPMASRSGPIRNM